MLTVTSTAVVVIREIAERQGLPAGAGVRITSLPSSWNGIPALEIKLADRPQAADEVVEAEGVRVFLDPTASLVLDGQSLDAVVRKGKAKFVIARQAD